MPASLCEEERPGTEKKRHREEAGEDGGERDGVPDSRELGEGEAGFQLSRESDAGLESRTLGS